MNLISYESINDLKFGDAPERAEEWFGEAGFQLRNSEGELEVFYDDFTLRFSAEGNALRECTLPFGVRAMLNGGELDWSGAGLRSLCRLDGEQDMNPYGMGDDRA